MPTIAEAASQIVAANLPVLFLDTCVLLDIIRSIKRRNKDCVAAAKAIHETATAENPRCITVISHLVRHEWTTHREEILLEANRHLVEMEEQSRCFHDACGVLSVSTGFSRSDYAAHRLPEALLALSRGVLDVSIELGADNECSGRAMHRVIHNIPPSRKSGEAKDCSILEEYLALCRALQAAGFARNRVFCTSNTNDYCEVGSRLHSNLTAEFAAVDLQFTANLPWAFHALMQ